MTDIQAMKGALITGAVLIALGGLALFGRYDYIQRGGEAVRVDRITGRASVLRSVQGGGATWVALKTPGEIAEQKSAEIARCKERPIPDSQRAMVSARSVGRFVKVKNDSAWTVRDIEATVGGTPTLLRRVDDSVPLDRSDPLNEYAIQIADRAPRQLVPGNGFVADFEPVSGPTLTGEVNVLRVTGVPADCH